MNPLAHTALQTYLKELIDRHLPGKDREDKDRAGKAKPLSLQADSPRPMNANRGKPE